MADESKRGTDAQILTERKLTCEAINGAMSFGYLNANPPPGDDHWLAPFWTTGRKQAELEALAAQTAETPTSGANPIYECGARTSGGFVWWQVTKAVYDQRQNGCTPTRVVYAGPVVQSPAQQGGDALTFECALSELVNKIDSGLDTGDLLADAKRVSAAIDAILRDGDLVACAHEYFRDSGERYEKSTEFRIGWNACLDAIGKARAALASPSVVSEPLAIYQTGWSNQETVWGDVPKDAYDTYTEFGYTRRRIVYATPQPAQTERMLTGWQPIETAPKAGRTLLLGYPNVLGKWRTVRGEWMSKARIEQNWEEPDEAEAGWYETSVEADDAPNCWPITPTHWMPLPAAPVAVKPASGESA